MNQRLIWLSDIHLNFVTTGQFDEFCQRVSKESPDGVLLGGDIGESYDVAHYLIKMDDAWKIPLYFVLGNHDYYRGSIRSVREQLLQLCKVRPRLNYLTQSDFISLTSETALIGHDGWADGRVGDFEKSQVMMNDYRLIEDLANLDKQQRLSKLHELGNGAAAHISRVLPQALAEHQHVILLTHVPPLRDACWYEGQISDDQWAPHFVCQAMGEAILSIMSEHPKQRLTVYCGHTHSGGVTEPLPNVKILTAAAEYKQPAIQCLIEI